MIDMAYCDEIQNTICEHMKKTRFDVVSRKFDLDTAGAMLSTRKFITLEDSNGKKYKITVEEV